MTRAFVSVAALGITDADTDEVIVTFYGPRGGTRATESVTPDEALSLSTALRVAGFEVKRKIKEG